MSGRRVRMYELYPHGAGFSTRTDHYHGETITIAAVSIKQAYAFAGRRVWATNPDDPLGIVETYRRDSHPDGWHRLWDGCHTHGGLAPSATSSRRA